MGVANAECEPGPGESVLQFDQAEHLIAGPVDGEFHVMDTDMSEAEGFYERTNHLVMRDDLMRQC